MLLTRKLRLGDPTASFAPSVSSVYAAKQNMQGAVFLALSQSGKSPDLLASASAAKEAGTLVIALVNVVDSPLAELADEVVPLHAGTETNVAGKSYAGAVNLPSLESAAAATAPIVFIQSFYKMVNALAIVRGYDPDSPPHLRKVTETM